jgi:hypothetical protein
MTAQVISLQAVRLALPPRTRPPLQDAARTLVFVPIGVWRAQRCALCATPIPPADRASRAEGLRPGFKGVRRMDLHPPCLRALQVVSAELG